MKSPDVTLDFILDERGRELIGEGHRWMDLTRTNTLVERVRKYNPVGGLNIQDFHIVIPIPQDQIDSYCGRISPKYRIQLGINST